MEKGALWQTVLATEERARSSGALKSFPTEQAFIEDRGVRFLVRVMAALRRKTEERDRQGAGASGAANPFLPPEPDLTVAGVTDSHLAVLNKYNVVDHHLLIVTRHFEDQETLLTPRDFEALWLCMAEYDGLGFYNGGREAGASQRHKHLQLVPLPLAPGVPRTPIEPLLPGRGASALPERVPAFPFRHAFVRLRAGIEDRPRDAAIESFRLYRSMLDGVGMAVHSGGPLPRQSMPYCLLITRCWMLLVPRSREHFEDISLNALAFAGSFFVWDRDQLGRLERAGPFAALRAVTIP